MSIAPKLFRIFVPIALMASVAYTAVKAPDGDERPLTSTDYLFHSTSGDGFTENWSYQFVFTNGMKAWVNFSRANIPTKGLKTGVDLTFHNFHGKKKAVAREYPKERFKQDAANQTLSIKSGKSLFHMKGLPKKGHEVLFSTDKGKGYFLDMKFINAIPGKVPGNGTWKLNGKEKATYQQFIHIPYGQVEGRIAYGKDTISVKGYAYMDHIVSTKMSTETTNDAAIFSSPSASIAGRLGTATKDFGRGHFGYAIEFKDGKSHVLRPAKVSIQKKTLTTEWDNLETYTFTSSSHKLCYSPLDNIDGNFARWAAKKILGGKVVLCGGQATSEKGPIDYLRFVVED